MFVKEVTLDAALEIIETARPEISPNDGFISQLRLFQGTSYKLSRWNKPTRMFYLDRAAREVLNGDGSDLPLHMLAKYPRSPGDSGPATPGVSRRRIRCRLCRQELATREHLMHNTLSATSSPANSRHPSFGEYFPISPQSRRNSSTNQVRPLALNFSNMSMTSGDKPSGETPSAHLGYPIRRQSHSNVTAATVPSDDIPNHSTSALDSDEEDTLDNEIRGAMNPLHQLKSPARRRSSNLMMTPIKQRESAQDAIQVQSPPLIMNPSCSGYFLEPMKWMEPFLEGGAVAGKIICPNEKCGAKLGNFDWAGVMCSCREWVTPGFCIARSKVDEVL